MDNLPPLLIAESNPTHGLFELTDIYEPVAIQIENLKGLLDLLLVQSLLSIGGSYDKLGEIYLPVVINIRLAH